MSARSAFARGANPLRRSPLAVCLFIALALAAGIALRPLRAEAQEEAAVAADAIGEYAENLRVGPPRRHLNLTLYPVFADGVADPGVALTLQLAVERELLEIRELDPPQVNRVLVLSRAKEPIFLMGGEMLEGAKQDRIVGDDTIVPAGAKIELPVFCIERGRWVAKGETFAPAGALATSAVRRARARADQSLVWGQVAAEQERLSAPSDTGALRSLRESPEVRARTAAYQRALGSFPEDLPRARGVVACVGGEIIAADLFGSQALFQRLWPALLESYIVDAVDRPERGRAPDAVQIRRWLEGVRRAERTPRDTPGAGELLELGGAGIIGSALIYQSAVVHMELFRGLVGRPVPFNRIEFRRQRLGVDSPEGLD